MNPLKILHLSDFHFGMFRYSDPNELAVKITDNLLEQVRKVDVVVVSGDIFDGRSKTPDSDRQFAIAFFKTLCALLISKEISLPTFSNHDILIVPGNHDLSRESVNQFENFDLFIKEYYPAGRISKNITFIDKYNFFYKNEQSKVVILGFNSCKIEVQKYKDEDLEWINHIDLGEFDEPGQIKQKIKDYKISEKKDWDDYGYLDALEVDNVFVQLKKDVKDIQDYTLVAVLHHHFYPFPEIINKHGDTSLIRNYSVIVPKFQRERVSLVLHGHKHLAIQRIVSDNRYFENPESVIYVLAAGSIGYKYTEHPSFQWLRIFGKTEPKLAEGERYDFHEEELDSIKFFSLPPQKKEERSISIQLLETLHNEDIKLFQEYVKITDDFEQVIHDVGIDKIIETISNLITIFKDIKHELKKDPKIIFVILLCVNYRVIYLSMTRTKQNVIKLQESLDKISDSLITCFSEKDYASKLFSFLTAQNAEDIDHGYDKIMKNVKASEKRYSSYISICLFFTDLFLTISKYGEYYFEKEGLNHKINIILEKNLFYNNIPDQSISIESDVDRRAVFLSFKCNNPTVHKIAVLIVKDFEMRLGKFEDSLREINLKLYYLIPKVTPHNYDLENFHFDAYIPKLLPLLTGDNLYQQKEVFIRELVQNALDAILLRKKLFPADKFTDVITIELGVEQRNKKANRYFKIIDHGIGMSKFTIERYFTSIGRSFYVSEEFDELKKNKKIKYNAISNFGIGFLSSFMVCKEILVKTKSVLEKSGSLEIEIPNYDGCFFIRNIEKVDYGTEIILYEDERAFFDFKKFETYIKETFLNLELQIKIVDNINPLQSFNIIKYYKQHEFAVQLTKQKEMVFFIPFSVDRGLESFSWFKDYYKKKGKSKYPYGIYFNFSRVGDSVSGAVTTLNQGLKIGKPHLPFKIKDFRFYPEILISYPSAFIQLDVSREKVTFFKASETLKNLGSNVINSLANQTIEFLESKNDIIQFHTPAQINLLGYFFLSVKNEIFERFQYYIKLRLLPDETVRLSLVNHSDSDNNKSDPKEFHFINYKNKAEKKWRNVFGIIAQKSLATVPEEVRRRLLEFEVDKDILSLTENFRRLVYRKARKPGEKIFLRFESRFGRRMHIEDPDTESRYLLQFHAHNLHSEPVIREAIESGKLQKLINFLYVVGFSSLIEKVNNKQKELFPSDLERAITSNLERIQELLLSTLTIKEFEELDLVINI